MEQQSIPRDTLFEQLGVDTGISTVGMIERIAELRAGQRHWGETQEEFAKAGILSAMLNDLRAYDANPEASGFYDNCLSPIMQLSQGGSVVLGESSIKEIDTYLYRSALDVVQGKDEPAHIKDAFVAASLYFAFETPHGVQKVERVLGDLMSAMRQAEDKRSTFTKRSSARGQVQAINAYLEMSGLAPKIVHSPSQLSQLASFGRNEVKTGLVSARGHVSAASESATHFAYMAGQEVAKNKTRIVSTAVAATIFGGIVPLAATAAELPGNSEQQVVVTAPLSSAEGRQSVQVPVAERLSSANDSVNFGSVPKAPALGTVSVEAAAPLSAEVVPASVNFGFEATPEVKVNTVIVSAADKIAPSADAPTVSFSPVQQDAPKPASVTVEQAAPLETPVTPENLTISVPDSNVNIQEGETPQQAVDRLVQSRDIDNTSYAIRQAYGIAGVDAALVNEKLVTAIKADTVELTNLFNAAHHADGAYTERSFKALAFLDAAVKNPTILDKPEVAEFLKTLSDQGEDYRNKLFAQYLAEADKQLLAEENGALTGYSDEHRSALKTLYAYAAFAAVPDAKQEEQINAIKAEEARIAEEARLAAEKAAQDAAESAGEFVAPSEQEALSRVGQKMIELGGDWVNRGTAFKYFVEHGFTPNQASGKLGNMIVESGVDPAKHQYNGGAGRGTCQWGSTNPKFDRFGYDGKSGLVLFAQQQGKPWDDLMVQLDFIMYEYSTTEKAAFNAVMATTTVREAAFEFEDKFERAGIPNMDNRYEQANVVADQYAALREVVNSEIAAEAEAARVAAEAARIAEEKAAAENPSINMPDGREIRAALEAKYDGVSGRLSPEDLTSVESFNQRGEPMNIQLQADAAESYKLLNEAFKAQFGQDIHVTDHYRSYEGQVRMKEYWESRNNPEKAATPGKSNHGWGEALDLASEINNDASAQHKWMEDNAAKYGWINTNYHQNKNSKHYEPWHWEFTGKGGQY